MLIILCFLHYLGFCVVCVVYRVMCSYMGLFQLSSFVYSLLLCVPGFVLFLIYCIYKALEFIVYFFVSFYFVLYFILFLLCFFYLCYPLCLLVFCTM